ncbi:hypothetical protein BU16DRAFT_530309 [Lophium mytilinum]|uniref:BTB domain-containing protein n=1 Tax=Lophium mytilinum TaxID=390894 RepID=A0A6A6QHJ0_9PEZI|nr:hypothetical protein BU16DRAFT_530309 [Lophium mytilinum]
MTDKRYIYQVSKFFANALKGGFREAEERVLRLPDDDPAAFRLWTHFQRNEYGYNESEGAAYRTSPYKSTKKEDPERTDHMWNFVKGWIFGEKYGFPEFQDFMMTSLRGICAEGFVEELFIARDTPHFSSNEHKCGQVSYVGPGYNVDPNDTWGTEPPTREDYADTHNWRCDCTHNVVWEMMSDLFLVEGNKAWFALKVQCEGKESQEPSGGW